MLSSRAKHSQPTWSLSRYWQECLGVVVDQPWRPISALQIASHHLQPPHALPLALNCTVQAVQSRHTPVDARGSNSSSNSQPQSNSSVALRASSFQQLLRQNFTEIIWHARPENTKPPPLLVEPALPRWLAERATSPDEMTQQNVPISETFTMHCL